MINSTTEIFTNNYFDKEIMCYREKEKEMKEDKEF